VVKLAVEGHFAEVAAGAVEAAIGDDAGGVGLSLGFAVGAVSGAGAGRSVGWAAVRGRGGRERSGLSRGDRCPIGSAAMANTEETKSQGPVPRPKAHPLTWAELSAEQQTAARDACSLLLAIAKEPWEKPKARDGARLFLPPIDEKRLNHVLLLDGSRGSGKTALLITLLDASNQWVLKDTRKDLAGEKKRGDWAPIVPVGLVDLQPLPVSTNLLLHLVGQFQRLLEALEQHGAEGSVKGREASAWFDEA
jgi:hypothetical protein